MGHDDHLLCAIQMYAWWALTPGRSWGGGRGITWAGDIWNISMTALKGPRTGLDEILYTMKLIFSVSHLFPEVFDNLFFYVKKSRVLSDLSKQAKNKTKKKQQKNQETIPVSNNLPIEGAQLREMMITSAGDYINKGDAPSWNQPKEKTWNLLILVSGRMTVFGRFQRSAFHMSDIAHMAWEPGQTESGMTDHFHPENWRFAKKNFQD